MINYDSTEDTQNHIDRVRDIMSNMIMNLQHRSFVHDKSKFSQQEKPYFDIATPKLKTLKFGTPEYKESLDSIKPALDHHYKMNDHHPEHYSNGINGMSLLSIFEMMADWKASSERQSEKILNLTFCFQRFKIDPQLQNIMINTAKEMKWDYK